MERLAEGDNGLLGYRQQKSFENSQIARPSSLEMDFNDVFGGPPRRYSMQEMKMRYSFNEPFVEAEDEAVMESDPWSGLNEKPVFGEESVNRRRYARDNFFDDIFRGGGDESSYGSPKRSDYGSNPGSRMLSPALSLPPKAEPLSTSVPAQSSLPAKLANATDSTIFASDNNSSTNKNKDGISNGISSPQFSKASFSKFLNHAIKGKSEARGDRQAYRQSPLSREVSVDKESPQVLKFDEKGKRNHADKKSENVDSPNDGSQFHFSIYKWADGGVPLMTPIREGKNTKLEENTKIKRCSSTKGKTVFGILDSEFHERDGEISAADAETKFDKFESKNEDKTSNQDKTESQETEKVVNIEDAETKSVNGVKYSAAVNKATSSDRSEELQPSRKVDETDKFNTAVPKNAEQDPASRVELRPLRSLFGDTVEGQGNSSVVNESAAEGRKEAKSANISNKEKKPATTSKKEKKMDAKKKVSSRTVMDKDSTSGSPADSADVPDKPGVKGKVRDFVKIFSHESTGRTKVNVDTRSQSSRWNGRDKYGTDTEVTFTHKMTEKVDIPEIFNSPDAFVREDENLSTDKVKQPSSIKTPNHSSCRYTGPNPENYKDKSGKTEDPFQGSFSVEELSHDQDKSSQTSGDDIEASDAKIQQWSQGRKGNIRSLLSTLQYVLWTGSGWKPVALVDIIEGSAVKRAYQKALLCLHPDKLQQKGAASHHKYIAEKVFDILQEAWDQFNSLGAI